MHIINNSQFGCFKLLHFNSNTHFCVIDNVSGRFLIAN